MSAAIKPGYKQTEVGVIPEDWECQPLGRHRFIVAIRLRACKAPFVANGHSSCQRAE